MIKVALQMLIGDKARYFALIVGLGAASLLTTQQVGIFLGYMTRTWSFIDDTAEPDIWVMNPQLQFTDDHKRMADTMVDRVRGVAGVRWAVPMFKGFLEARMPDGHQEEVTVIGLDDSTLTGAPNLVDSARITDLRSDDNVVIDVRERDSRLAHQDADGRVIAPLKPGDTFEINDHQVRVAGFCKIKRPFFWEPVVYSTYSVAKKVSPPERRLRCYVLVKASPGSNLSELCRQIEAATGQRALTSDQFRAMTASYVVRQTGIAINFGIAVLLGFLIGAAIAGQTFYSFTLDHMRHFGAMKAMGASNGQLLKMVLVQAATVGVLGYGLGVGGAAIFGELVRDTELAFRLPWQLLAANSGVVTLACMIPAAFAIRKVMRLEPAVVFRS